MAELPTGTVTFLFTDIEGSTKLLHELGDDYADVLAEHRRILREAFSAHDGVEVDTQGDAFFVAFPRATDAADAAAESQRALAEGPVRVRMGIHTGEPIRTDEGYVGLDVHRAARIAAAGHGGQVLVSQTSRDLLDGHVDLSDLGQHRLKDLTAAQRIFQLGEGDFPPLKSLNRTNLPVAANVLVGRDQELEELGALLSNSARLVTVTGTGGSGKTRLALQVAAELSDEYRDGVFFVPLAPVHEAELVVPTIEQAVSVRELAELGPAEALLVLDNFEHLLAVAGDLSAFLATAPAVKLLVTSRAPLRIAAEHEYALEPLKEDEAVELFLRRARAVKREVTLDQSVAAICRRLDGLPLALELAASRVKILDPPVLLERLDSRLALLTGGARDAPERQQTLRATIEWSYGFLEPALQLAFRRLSIFAGSFSLEAADAVAETDLEDVASLVDWSLVKPSGEGRFFVLETIREYAAELLERDRDYDRLRDLHLGFFLNLVEEAEPKVTGPDQAEWYHRLGVEQDNIREALAYACDSRDAERGQRLAGSIWRFWISHGYVEEAGRWYDRVLGLGEETSARARARALFGAAHVAENHSDMKLALTQFGEAIDLFRASEGSADDTRWLILALTHVAVASTEEGDSQEGRRLSAEALELARSTRDIRGEAVILGNMAHQQTVEGDTAGAEKLLEHSLDLFRTVGDVYGVATSLSDLALHAFRRGDLEAASRNIRESLGLSSSIGDALTSVHTLVVASGVALAREHDDACARLCGAAETLSAANGFEIFVLERRLIDETTEAARERLGDRFQAEYSAGSALELEAAVELALASLEPSAAT
jgi:predicted ATPase/class 3 adenylate cyclase